MNGWLYLSCSGCGESVEFEGVGSVSMDEIFGHVLGQVDNLDGLERALLDAHVAADAERFFDDTDFIRRLHEDALLAGFVDRAC